jgi:hypothetical protein
MVECQLKGLCYNCDEKYFHGHKCKEQKIFMSISGDVVEEEVEVPPVEEILPIYATTSLVDPPEVEPMISLHVVTSFSAPQTLKIIGYIKHRKVIFLVDSGNTHNCIRHCIAQEINCYIHVTHNFQIMIANCGSMKCGGHCENVHLQIGEYHLKYHMFSIDMGGCNIMLDVEWLHTLGPILMDLKELTMNLQQEGKLYRFQGITTGSPNIIGSHQMEKFLKKGHSGIIYQPHSIQGVETPFMHPDLQYIISKHQALFSTP